MLQLLCNFSCLKKSFYRIETMPKRTYKGSHLLAKAAHKLLPYALSILTICTLVSCETATKKPVIEKNKAQSTELTDTQNPLGNQHKDSITKKPTFSPPVKNAAFVEVEEVSTEQNTNRDPLQNPMGEIKDREQPQSSRTTSQNSSQRKDLTAESSVLQNTTGSKASLFSPTTASGSQTKETTGGIKVNIGTQRDTKSTNRIRIREKGPKEEWLGAPAEEGSGMGETRKIGSGGGSGMPEVSSGNAGSNKGSTYGAPDRLIETELESPKLLKKDDDIVARQLREAAESETDAELSEKLWNEYKRYKSGL
jgi:hypothetical protein